MLPPYAIATKGAHLLDVLIEEEDAIVEPVLVDALAKERERPRPFHHADLVPDCTPAPAARNRVTERNRQVGRDELRHLGRVAERGRDGIVRVRGRERRIRERDAEDREQEVWRDAFRCGKDGFDWKDVREERDELSPASLRRQREFGMGLAARVPILESVSSSLGTGLQAVAHAAACSSRCTSLRASPCSRSSIWARSSRSRRCRKRARRISSSYCSAQKSQGQRQRKKPLARRGTTFRQLAVDRLFDPFEVLKPVAELSSESVLTMRKIETQRPRSFSSAQHLRSFSSAKARNEKHTPVRTTLPPHPPSLAPPFLAGPRPPS